MIVNATGPEPMNVTGVIPSRHWALDMAIHQEMQMAFLDGWKVWDNSSSPFDAKCFGRFLGGLNSSDLIYTQDDDVIVPRDTIRAICARAPGSIVCNMAADFQRDYADRPEKLLGWGSCFPRALIRETFERYLRVFPVIDNVFLRECDRIFTALNKDRIHGEKIIAKMYGKSFNAKLATTPKDELAREEPTVPTNFAPQTTKPTVSDVKKNLEAAFAQNG